MYFARPILLCAMCQPDAMCLCSWVLSYAERHVVQHATGRYGKLHHGALQLCRSAVGLVPADIVRGHNCSASIYSEIASACIPDQNPQNILGSQHLFSVYIHIPPGETGAKQPLPTRTALQMPQLPPRLVISYITLP